jgi:hypothetical protein
MQLLLVVMYLMSGTLVVVLIFGWALKRFGQPKTEKDEPHTTARRRPEHPYSPSQPQSTKHLNGDK